MKTAKELLKAVGGVALIMGAALLFLMPEMGIILLLFAGVVGALSVTWTRRERNEQTIATMRSAKANHAPSTTMAASSDPAVRLRRLEELRNSGALSDQEYASKRSQILDDI
jgi:hypothetical protein